MMSSPLEESKGKVLVVDDSPELRRAYDRVLVTAGWQVESVASGVEALDVIDAGYHPDVVFSDICMPEMDGVTFLRAVHERDCDLPVALITAQPGIDSAIAAVQHGAFQYVPKPVEPKLLLGIAQKAARLYQFARLRREAARDLAAQDAAASVGREDLALALKRALDGLWMAYQPIVSWERRCVFAHEALMRTTDTRLPFPGAILRAAEQLDRSQDVGRAVRAHVAETIDRLSPQCSTFVNLHVRDLLDDTLFERSSPFAKHAPNLVLEITERAALSEVPDLRARIDRLRGLGFRIAVDDLGAGYSGLTSIAQIEPDILKIDMSLVRDISASSTKLKLVRSITAMAHDMGIQVVAEGVETAAERDKLVDAGCDLFQGYLFARPEKPFPEVRW